MGEPKDQSRRVFFDPPRPFNDVFPNVEAANVNYTESGEFETKRSRVSRHYQPYREEPEPRFHSIKHEGMQIRCSNPRCRRGGYEFNFILSEMTRSKEAERRGSISCGGDEGSPKGLHRRSPCGNQIQYTVLVKYK